MLFYKQIKFLNLIENYEIFRAEHENPKEREMRLQRISDYEQRFTVIWKIVLSIVSFFTLTIFYYETVQVSSNPIKLGRYR